MNKIQKRKIEQWVESICLNYQAGWGEHELHDQMLALAKYIESVKDFSDRGNNGRSEEVV